MAVGMIKSCDKCGESWDSGKTSFHYCNPSRIKKKEKKESWPTMTLEEKCEWLKNRIDEVERSIPYDGAY